MYLVTVKKFDICLLTEWSSTVFILLVKIFTHTFNQQNKHCTNKINTTPPSQQTYIKLFLP